MATAVYKSNVLQSTAKSGKAKFWQIMAYRENGEYFYKKIWWQEGAKHQESTPVRVTGKNVGRANETTDKDQAIFEAKSKEQHQRDKGYSEDGSDDHIPVKPMLAKKYRNHPDKVKFPCYVQPKLDGFRMILDNGVGYTRGGKEHTPECIKHLVWDCPEIVDGELMLPGNVPLQQTSSAAKRYQKGVSETLIYMVYDIVAPDKTFEERSRLLRKLVEDAPKNVHFVETLAVQDEEELFAAHAKFTKHGFEGTMVRNADGKYLIGYRSMDLLKLKDFQDAEFKIIDVEEGKGSFEGHAIMVCETDKGVRFNATPEGSMDYREQLWHDRKQYVGKWLTVRYQTLSDDGVPIFPVGVDFRDEGEF